MLDILLSRTSTSLQSFLLTQMRDQFRGRARLLLGDLGLDHVGKRASQVDAVDAGETNAGSILTRLELLESHDAVGKHILTNPLLVSLLDWLHTLTSGHVNEATILKLNLVDRQEVAAIRDH